MKTIRFNVWDLRADRREAVTEWVRSLGINTGDVAANTAIVPGDQGWELHLSRYLRDENGAIRLDVAREDAVTEPVIVPLGATKTWPDLGPEAEATPVTVRLNALDGETAQVIRDAVTKAIKTTRERF